jgi:hypothetical protein
VDELIKLFEEELEYMNKTTEVILTKEDCELILKALKNLNN